jgi:hypothetical protein
MCLGGVFGGEDSGVSDSTVNVLLESAYFDPGSIRRTSKKHQLQTDASFHNERGGDPLVTVYAAKRAADLIVKVAGGHVSGKMQEFCPSPYKEKEIDLDYDRIEEFIGKKGFAAKGKKCHSYDLKAVKFIEPLPEDEPEDEDTAPESEPGTAPASTPGISDDQTPEVPETESPVVPDVPDGGSDDDPSSPLDLDIDFEPTLF